MIKKTGILITIIIFSCVIEVHKINIYISFSYVKARHIIFKKNTVTITKFKLWEVSVLYILLYVYCWDLGQDKNESVIEWGTNQIWSNFILLHLFNLNEELINKKNFTEYLTEILVFLSIVTQTIIWFEILVVDPNLYSYTLFVNLHTQSGYPLAIDSGHVHFSTVWREQCVCNCRRIYTNKIA